LASLGYFNAHHEGRSNERTFYFIFLMR